jgi:hypothetical protein
MKHDVTISPLPDGSFAAALQDSDDRRKAPADILAFPVEGLTPDEQVMLESLVRKGGRTDRAKEVLGKLITLAVNAAVAHAREQNAVAADAA